MTDKNGKLILVVDDVQMNVDILLAILGPEYDVSVALNGETALQIAKQEIPDLILLDVIMPKVNGFEVCKQLKADDSLKDIPVIFLSALNEEREHQTGLALGAIDFIDKPFDIDDIRRKVKSILVN
jgi:putative two-component system response regulator